MVDAEGWEEVHAGQVQPKKAATPEESEEQVILAEVKENFALVTSVEDQQRQQEDDDLEFEGLSQWDTAATTSRSEHVDDKTNLTVPARPALTINLVEQRVQEVVNEARQAKLGISVQPKAGLANTKNSNYYKGLIRSIQVDSGAVEVRNWALERTAKCGRGSYLIDVDYANDGDFDLDIIVKRILDQSTVYFDPFAQRADRADAEWALVAEWLSEQARLRRWPKKPIIHTDGAFDGPNNPWFAIDDKDHKSVRIVTYYKVIFEEHWLVHHPNIGKIGPLPFDKLPKPAQDVVTDRTKGWTIRQVPKRRVMQYILDGSQILETDPWLGRYIPIIPVSGKEYVIKGKRSWKGIVTNLKGAQRGYNVAISSAVETAGAMPRSPYVAAEGQIDEDYEEMWQDSPIKNYVYLIYKPTSHDGHLVGPPQRQNLEPQIQGILLLARVLKDDIGSMSGRVDPALRAVNPQDRSGKAIDLLLRQGAAGSGNYLDNLATVSMMHEGRVYIDLIPKVYDKRGRVIGVMDDEGEDERPIMLKVPFVRDEEGNPVPVPCPQCQGSKQEPQKVMGRVMSMLTPRQAPAVCRVCEGDGWATEESMKVYKGQYDEQDIEYVDLTKGEFKVSVALARQHQTKQDEALAHMLELAKVAPELVPAYADLLVRSMGFPGSTEIADRLKRMNPNAADDKGNKKLPPEIAAKVQQLQMEHQAAMQALDEATRALETDQVKMEGQKQLQLMKAEAAAGLENMKQQRELMKQIREQQGTEDLTVLEGQLDALMQENEHRHEVFLEMLKIKAQQQLQSRQLAVQDQQDVRATQQTSADRQSKDLHAYADRDQTERQSNADRQLEDQQAREDREQTERQSNADRALTERQAAAERAHSAQQSDADREVKKQTAAKAKPPVK